MIVSTLAASLLVKEILHPIQDSGKEEFWVWSLDLGFRV